MRMRIKSSIKRLPFVSPVYDDLWRMKKSLKREIVKEKKAFAERKNITTLLFSIYRIKLFYPKKAFLLLSPDYENVGDHAILFAERKMFRQNRIPFFEVTTQQCVALLRFHKTSVFNGRKVLITGGGFIGTLWSTADEIVLRIIKDNPKSKIFVLPNSVFYEDSPKGDRLFRQSIEAYRQHKNLYLFLREEISYQKMREVYQKSFLAPDMVLSLPAFSVPCKREGCMLVLRSDHEKTMSKSEYELLLSQVKELFGENVIFSDMCKTYNIGTEEREKELTEKLREFCKVELVITDRLHGMLFAAITGTPCIVINSKSHKIQGCYEWIKSLGYIRICDNYRSIESVWREIGKNDCHYDNSNLLPLYREMVEMIKEK